jgi:hypothetical protein
MGVMARSVDFFVEPVFAWGWAQWDGPPLVVWMGVIDLAINQKQMQ